MKKTFDIILDFTGSNSKIPLINMTSGDTDAYIFNVTLVDKDNVIDLTGQTVTFIFAKSDSTKIDKDATIIDAINGKVSLDIDTNMIAALGIVKVQVQLKDNNTSRLSSNKFYFTVEKSLVDDSVIESSNEYSSLVLALSKVNGYMNRSLFASSYPRITGEADDRGRLQRLFDDCKAQNKIASLESFTKYTITSYNTIKNRALEIDLSYISVEGNGSTLDFTGNPAQDSLYITASKTPAYYQNHIGKVSNLFLEGKSTGTNRNNSNAICFDTLINNSAIAHIDLEKINIHGFATGIAYKNHAYLIRHYSLDIVDCTKHLYLPSGYTDAGENITFYGCTFYNGGTAVTIGNSNGDFAFFGCSFDYNSQEFDISSSLVLLSQCHIEGDIEKVSGNGGTLQISESRLIYHNTSSYTPFDVSTDCKGIFIKNCYIDGGTFNGTGKYDMVANGGTVKIEGSKGYGIYVDFFTNYLNTNSMNFSPKNLDTEVYSYLDGAIFNTLKAKNITITRDTSVFESGTFSTKFYKTYGAYSASGFYIFVKLQSNTRRANYRIRWKSDIAIPANAMSINLMWASCARRQNMITTTTIDATSTGGSDKHTHTFAEDIYLTQLSQTQSIVDIGQWVSLSNNWSTFSGIIQSIKPSWANYLVFKVDLNVVSGSPSIYIDKLEVYEF
jgi:hypothetical protein